MTSSDPGLVIETGEKSSLTAKEIIHQMTASVAETISTNPVNTEQTTRDLRMLRAAASQLIGRLVAADRETDVDEFADDFDPEGDDDGSNCD